MSKLQSQSNSNESTNSQMNNSHQKSKKEEMALKNGYLDHIFDYSQCLFQIQVQKPGFFKKTVYYLYAKHGQLIICQKPYDRKPHKIIDLKMNWKVKFIFDEKKHIKKQPFVQKVIGFKLIESFLKDQNKLHIEYLGEGYAMVQIKQFFSKELFLTNFYDDFSILEKLGQGKYAKVYRIQAKDTGEFYAVKYLYKQKLIAQEVGEEALLNELKILYQMDHPNVVKHVATYEDEQGYYIVTELLDDEHCLHKEIRKFRETKFDYEVVKIIMQQLLKGIEYIHSKGIMHRDLKPQNIMFAKKKGNGESSTANYRALKIIDFGLAQYFDDPHFIFVHVGTPGYVAPEILSNEKDTHRYKQKCDIFSLGVIFHLLLTGKQVFEGTKFKEVLDLNKKCRIKFEGQIYEKLNYQALNLITRMLDPNPQTRVSATEALKHDFFQETQRRRRASQILLEDLEYEKESESELDQIDSHESLENSSNNDANKMLEIGSKNSSNQAKKQGQRPSKFAKLQLQKYTSYLQSNHKNFTRQEVLYNKYKSNSFSTLSQRDQKYNNKKIDTKELLKPIKTDQIKSPFKLQTHRINILEPYQYEDVEIGENEIDILPSPSKQNLGKNREEILEMTYQLFQYMRNAKEEKIKQYEQYEQEEEQEEQLQPSQIVANNDDNLFSLRKLENKKTSSSSSNSQKEKKLRENVKEKELNQNQQNLGKNIEISKKTSSSSSNKEEDNQLSPEEHKELRSQTEVYEQMDKNLEDEDKDKQSYNDNKLSQVKMEKEDKFLKNLSNSDKKRGKDVKSIQIDNSAYKLDDPKQQQKIVNKRISALQANINKGKEEIYSSTTKRKRKSSIYHLDGIATESGYQEEEKNVESFEKKKMDERQEMINENPFNQNILNPKVVKLLNFFPQNIFVVEKFEEKMDILGKFILFGQQWYEYQGSNQKNPKNLVAIKKKIKFLEIKQAYKTWVFDFLKNIFFLQKWKSQEKSAEVPIIKVNLESCYQHFKFNIEGQADKPYSNEIKLGFFKNRY